MYDITSHTWYQINLIVPVYINLIDLSRPESVIPDIINKMIYVPEYSISDGCIKYAYPIQHRRRDIDIATNNVQPWTIQVPLSYNNTFIIHKKVTSFVRHYPHQRIALINICFSVTKL